MKRKLLLCLGLAAAIAQSAAAQAVWINLSYKLVLNSADGQPSPNATAANINQAIDQMNSLLAAHGRCYRVRLSTAIAPVGALGNMTGPSRWYDVNFFDTTQVNGQGQGRLWKDEMQSAAMSDAAYSWRNNAINIYITAGICGGTCSFPQENDDIIIIGDCSVGDGETQLHEIGHYFGLYHTQGRTCGCCGTGPGQCNTPGDDLISDTLPDLACWNQDQISMNSFGLPYESPRLSDDRRNMVDDTYFNLMSYRNAGCGAGVAAPRLTELQLDTWTTSANSSRSSVVSGLTWFVDSIHACPSPLGRSQCVGPPFVPSYGPFPTVTEGVNAASPGDIVLIRPGNYHEQAITRAVTLCATKAGPVTITR